ncbi:MarR family winged helix-turn-helix transcriptional regulator [Roseibium aggregatum]|uniref:MarR family transcriptional regulator n=1 Tax=Roseibium aggregatum TaxID=187304 RepID=A0A939EDT0_9HYPH|nr:MarR family transcriptional regulator [Roseibium aggregatum]MBN9671431.1 MarR family transcriptional regulator [Roseibium aggregatum]
MTDDTAPGQSLPDLPGINGRDAAVAEPEFDLELFFPYLVRVFYADVTQALSAVYQRDYGMSPAEWRTMAILGSNAHGLQATEIVSRSSMDKVVVSRAVKRMEERGFLVRETNAADGRSFLLRLSDEGRAVFEDLAPKLKAVERRMLSGLSQADISAFLAVAGRIRANLAGDEKGPVG